MEFEDSQFQSAASGGNGLNSFAAAIPDASDSFAPSAPGNGALDDFFSGSVPSFPAPVASSEALPVADLTAASAAGVIPANPFFETAVEDPGFVAQASDAVVDEDPFFQHYTPPAPSAPAPAPEVVDPRVEWRKQNNELLKKKDVEEVASKQKQKDSAAQFLSKFYEVRSATLTTRRGNNRKSEAHQKEVEVPVNGTAWEKVNALINLNSGNHTKDVARYKALLITCKAKNVAIRA